MLTFRTRLVRALAFLAASAFFTPLAAQETVDHSGAARVSPYPIKTFFPGACKFGDMLTYAGAGATPPSNVYICGATNDWHQFNVGGSATPGGAPGAVQYNNAGALGGAANISIVSGSPYFSAIANPAVAPIVTLAGMGAGNVDTGDHCYAYAYLTAGSGYTVVSSGAGGMTAVTVDDQSVDGQVSITVPISGDPRVNEVYVYRTKAGVTCMTADPYTSFYVSSDGPNDGLPIIDNIADTSLSADQNAALISVGRLNTTALLANTGTGFFPLLMSSRGGVNLNNAYYGSQGDVGPGPGLVITDNSATIQLTRFPSPPNAMQFFNGTGSFSSPFPSDSPGLLASDGAGSLTWSACCTVTPSVFASLGTPVDGSVLYCSNCTVTSGIDDTCAGSGTGAMAERINGAWTCRQ